jgi:hypothetical protein
MKYTPRQTIPGQTLELHSGPLFRMSGFQHLHLKPKGQAPLQITTDVDVGAVYCESCQNATYVVY